MTQKYSDVFSGIILLMIAVGMFVMTYSFEALTVSKVGPDFMPKIIALLIAVTSIFMIVSAFSKMKRESVKDTQIVDKEMDSTEEKSYKAVIISVLLMVGYLVLMPYVGFLVMTAIYLFLQMLLLSDKSDKKIVLFLAISIVSSVVIYFIFRSIFYVMLPSGILG